MSQQDAQQTPLIYPVSETNPPAHRQSDGSFGAVFIVLAVIVVISAVACFLGRLCSKRHSKFKPSKQGGHANRPPKEKDMKHNRNAFQTKDGDIEFGFDKRFSSAKVAANGEPAMGRPNSFREPNMGRPNSFKEPSMGRPESFREPSMGRPDSFREPSMGRPNSFRKGEFRDDQVRFAANQDHEMNFKSGNGPQHY
ncbi:uncharacterized protein LOC112525265 [Cynara cardunculus var. scolymus]|uniref:uncharacterized protein LOC112525265 n=1 Tax=Cynara cardunculus var. scolymus TaxID=59895 RepID=UPI000D62EAD7|nr:uncharacterized protein LOC112525265 [Cynara cardunculus var. scolymus]